MTDPDDPRGVTTSAWVLLALAGFVSLILVALLRPVPPYSPSESVKTDLTKAAIDRPLTDALKTYREHMGAYPTTAEGLRALVEPPTDPDLARKWVQCFDGGFLKDQWGHELHYVCPGEHNKDGFDLSSDGRDGVQGTDDDIANWPKASGRH